MPLEQALFIAAAAIAGLSLIKLMRRRQSHLTGLLRQYVGRQKEWALKREKAASMALRAAQEKSPQRDAVAIAELLQSNDATYPAVPSAPNTSPSRAENRASA